MSGVSSRTFLMEAASGQADLSIWTILADTFGLQHSTCSGVMSIASVEVSIVEACCWMISLRKVVVIVFGEL